MEVLRIPATHIRLLICFASGVRAILFVSCLATCAPGRSEGPSGPGSLFNRRPDLPVCSHADVSGISQVSRQSIPCLCPALETPTEPTIPRLLDGFVDAVPALPTAKTSAVNEFRGSVTRLWHPLPPLQESCCHHPCKARFRLAGLAFTGRASNPLDRCKRFQIIHPPFLDLAWRKGSFTALPLWSSQCRARNRARARDANRRQNKRLSEMPADSIAAATTKIGPRHVLLAALR